MASTLKVETIDTPDGTGNITVNRPLSGSGASLTNLPAANLTGSLPAISGASLTGIPAANITGVIPAANLGTGTASASTFLNGSGAYSAAGGGLIKQIIQNNVNTVSSQSITEDVVTNISNLSCPITPTSASSKILIQVAWFGETADPQNEQFGIKRGSTEVGSSPQVGVQSFGITSSGASMETDNGSTPSVAFYQFIDSPNTTSATTYYATFRDGYQAVTLYNNRTVVHGASGGYETGVSSITLTELESATVLTNGA